MKLASKLTILITTLITFCVFNNVHAELFQSPQSVSFTLNPAISITVSEDLTIESLTPGDYKDSNIITVTATSNAVAGYSLSSTVGDSTNASTELRKGGTDTTYKFTNLTTNKPSLSDFDSNTNTWGYSYCNTSSDCTNNTNWISGDITGTPTTGYNGLPIYTTTSPITLIDSPTSATSTIEFKIGARSTTTLVAGEYTNIINFIGIANNNPEIIYMQDATMADCGKTMVDIRDNNVYSTTNVEGTCWMTTNLNLAGDTVLSSTDTDFTEDYYPNLPNDNGWTVVADNKLKMPSSSTTGFDTNIPHAYLYNSARTICAYAQPCYSYYSWDAATLGSDRILASSKDAQYSICPKGWHLPTTRSGTDSSSDLRALMIALGGSDAIAIYNADTNPTGETMFALLLSEPLNFVKSGHYANNSLIHGGGAGYYWSATTATNTIARYLGVNTTVNSDAFGGYGSGFAIRCVKSS